MTGNYSKSAASEISAKIHQHINSPGTRVIEGTYRKLPVTHYLDPQSRVNVMAVDGEFLSVWRLGLQQVENVLGHGGL